MSNPINQTAADLNLVVSAVKVDTMNKVIFTTKYLNGLSGSDIVKDGDKVFKIDTVKNDAVEITAKSLSKAAEAGLLSVKNLNACEVDTAIRFGLVKEVKMTRGEIPTNGHSGNIFAFAKSLGLKIVDVTVEVQNDVIFKTQGISNLSGLDKLDGVYYRLDTVANTATVINPEAIATDVKKDILKGKNSDLVNFAMRYNLLSSIDFAVKADDAEKADK